MEELNGWRLTQPWLPHQGLEEEAAMGTKDSADFIRRPDGLREGTAGT